ncbi:MAG: hypothetical protein BAJALOKI1v1_1400003 [Promethearchaeota archaeon]|nr:MAG: hypothetical protein BAJALOKI1v1_1400003 [Candidatus Lokiarchaeota archaeon]
MEKRKDEVQEISKELKQKTDRELQKLREELYRLRKLKAQKEKERKIKEEEQKQALEEEIEVKTEVQSEKEAEILVKQATPAVTETPKEAAGSEQIEDSFQELDSLLSEELAKEDHKTYEKRASYIESQLQKLEQEIVGETGLIEEELSPYEKLLKEYPWLEQPRYEYMFQIPNKTKNPNDFESWCNEWSKVLFDYAKYAILHILYLRQLYTQKPFSNFENRKKAIQEISNKLVKQDLARWLSKKKEKLRVYWKTLDLLAEEIYEWAYEIGKLEPILVYEVREARKEFNNLPKEDIEKIIELLSENKRAELIKLDDGKIAFKIILE